MWRRGKCEGEGTDRLVKLDVVPLVLGSSSGNRRPLLLGDNDALLRSSRGSLGLDSRRSSLCLLGRRLDDGLAPDGLDDLRDGGRGGSGSLGDSDGLGSSDARLGRGDSSLGLGDKGGSSDGSSLDDRLGLLLSRGLDCERAGHEGEWGAVRE